MKRLNLPTVSCLNPPCGACCTGQAALPVAWYAGFQPMEDPGKLPPELLAELKAMGERFMVEGWPQDGTPCVWFDAETRQCQHYEHRPELCRDGVIPGDEACHRWRRVVGMEPTTRYRMKNGRLVKEVGSWQP